MTNNAELRYEINNIDIKNLDKLSNNDYITIYSKFIPPNIFEFGCNLFYNEYLLNRYKFLKDINALEKYKNTRYKIQNTQYKI